MTAKSPKRRNRFFPFWQLQSRVVAAVCLALAASTAAVGFFQAYYFPPAADPAVDVTGMALRICLIELVVFTPIFVLLAALVTRGIVGPLRRLPRDLRAVGGGDLHSPVKFRSGDRIHFVADAAQEMKNDLRRRIESCREAAGRLEELSRGLESGASAESLAALRRAARALSAELGEFTSPGNS